LNLNLAEAFPELGPMRPLAVSLGSRIIVFAINRLSRCHRMQQHRLAAILLVGDFYYTASY